MRVPRMGMVTCWLLLTFVACGDDAATGGGGGAPSTGGGANGAGAPAGGAGPGAGGGGGGGGGALQCAPLEARLEGLLGGAPIAGTFLPLGTSALGTVHSDFGDFGSLHLQREGQAEPGEPIAATGLLRLPNDSEVPGNWVCAGEGSVVSVSDDWTQVSATLRSLSVLGPCPGEPVAGEIAACFFDSACQSGLVSTVEAAAFDLPFDNFSTLVLHADESPLWDFESDFGSVMGFVGGRALDIDVMSTGEQVAVVESGFVILPDGVSDGRAVYCIGAGSTANYEMVDGQPVILRATLTGMSRVGACPGEAARGELEFCQRGDN